MNFLSISLTRQFSSFGNFVNRVLTFVAKNYEGVLPDGDDKEGPLSPNDNEDAAFISEVNSLFGQYIDALEAVKLRLGLQIIMQISAAGNAYLQSSGLNTALLTSNPKRCARVLCRAVNLIYALSPLVEPYMPATSTSILAQLNAPARTVPEALSIDILPGHTLGKPAHLFKRIDEKMAETWRAQFAGAKEEVAKVGSVDADKTHVVAPQLSKKKAAAAAKEAKKNAAAAVAAEAGPKSPEVVELEGKIAKQGDVVRTLKAAKPKTKEIDEQIVAGVEELKRLKAELSNLTKN